MADVFARNAAAVGIGTAIAAAPQLHGLAQLATCLQVRAATRLSGKSETAVSAPAVPGSTTKTNTISSWASGFAMGLSTVNFDRSAIEDDVVILVHQSRTARPCVRRGSGAGDGLLSSTPIGVDQTGGEQGFGRIAAVGKCERRDDAAIILVARYVGERDDGGGVQQAGER